MEALGEVKIILEKGKLSEKIKGKIEQNVGVEIVADEEPILSEGLMILINMLQISL
jgi:hypothetical protein